MVLLIQWNMKKEQEAGIRPDLSKFISTLVDLLVQPVIFKVVKFISGRGVRRAGTGSMIKKIISTPSFKQYQDH